MSEEHSFTAKEISDKLTDEHRAALYTLIEASMEQQDVPGSHFTIRVVEAGKFEAELGTGNGYKIAGGQADNMHMAIYQLMQVLTHIMEHVSGG